MERKLHRIPEQKVIGGVAAGIAQYMQIDVVIVRVLMVILLILPIPPSFGWTGFIYLILWAALPTGPALTSTEQADGVGGPRPSFDPFVDKKTTDQTIMVLGGALIFFGIIMLVDDFPIWYQLKQYFWPILLISIGAYLILRQRDQAQEQDHTIITPPPAPFTREPDPTPPNDANDVRTATNEGNSNDKKDEGDDIIRVN